MSKYFARCDNDVELDSTIRDTVVEDGSKTSMAMYLQGQEQLNLLRTLIVEQGVMMDELKSMKTLVGKTAELYQTITTIEKTPVSLVTMDSRVILAMACSSCREFLAQVHPVFCISPKRN